MKRWFTFILGLAIFASLASAEMIVRNASCADGLTLVVDNTGTYDFRAKDFTIVGTHVWSGRTIKFDGIWRNLADIPHRRLSGRMFLSNNSVEDYGPYIINVSRVSQVDSHLVGGAGYVTYRESKIVRVECEEKAFECSKVNLNIDECYTVGERYVGIISGVGGQRGFSKEKFSLKMVGRGHIYENLTPDDTVISEIASGRYYVSFLAPSFTDWTTVSIDGCDYERFPKTYDKEKCILPRACAKDTDCKDYERCNTNIGGFCEAVICDECEKAKGHVCVARCDDGNPCTADSCISGVCESRKMTGCCIDDSGCGNETACRKEVCANNRCVIREKECKGTDDPCVVGRCDDDKGCVYSVNPLCRASFLQRIVDWFVSFFR